MSSQSRGPQARRQSQGPNPAANDLPEGHAENNQELDNAGDPSAVAKERGDRLETGKAIARGGKNRGHVPGASEQKP